MDAMLGFAGGVMIAASFWSLLSPAAKMADSLNMLQWSALLPGFLSGGLLLYAGDKLFNPA
jgi:ZIP family zinc transporter